MGRASICSQYLLNARTTDNRVRFIRMKDDNEEFPLARIWDHGQLGVHINLPGKWRLTSPDTDLPMFLRHVSSRTILWTSFGAASVTLFRVRIP